jgi:ABC-type phosphate/phosphonate transport system substrate-binding protein
MDRPVRVGAVLYDPKVSVIWEIIRTFFETQGMPIDVTFYSSYELQVSALAEGSLDVAWNSPLAWLDAQRRSGGGCRAIAMRDTDRDRVSYLVAPSGGRVRKTADLRGRTVALGAIDSPQATLIPLGSLRREGLQPGRDVTIRRFDVLVGKHGDHIGGELEAFRSVRSGAADACAMLDLNWDAWTHDGTIDANEYLVVASTPRFDHCVFTVTAAFDRDAERRWVDALFAMRYDEPAHREMMDLEGLKAWLPGRTTGFGPLAAAVESERFFDTSGPAERRERSEPR